MVDPLSYFSLHSLLHDWCNKGHGMCYPVWDSTYNRTLVVGQKERNVAAAGFLSSYLRFPLPYARRHISVYKKC